MSQMINANMIQAGNNDRKQFNPKKLRELAENIAENGLAQPPTLRPIYECPQCGKSWQDRCAEHGDLTLTHYEIVCGERRVRAMRDVLKWEQIPCEIRAMDDKTASAIMLAENVARVNLNPIEEANGYFARMQVYNYSIAEMARVAGVNIEDVRNVLRLLKLVPEVQDLVANYQMAVPYAIRMSDLDSNRQRIALQVFVKAKNMPQWRWSEVINNLMDAQSAEITLPGFEMMFVEQAVADSRIRTGRKAITGALLSESLPPVRYVHGESMAETFERYILDLAAHNHQDASVAVGYIYTAFVARAIVNLPKHPTLLLSTVAAGEFPNEKIE